MWSQRSNWCGVDLFWLHCGIVVSIAIIGTAHADIIVFSTRNNRTYDSIDDLPAYFGPTIPDEGMLGVLVRANPPEACDEIEPPPFPKNMTGFKWFVLIRRSSYSSNCPFDRKVMNAQKASYDAAIIHNVGSEMLEPMGPSFSDHITIQSVFIGESDGQKLRDLYTFDKSYVLNITSDIPDNFWFINLDKFLAPFACILAACFLGAIISMIVKCVRDRQWERRHRISSKHLKKIPVLKYTKGDPYDVCAVCLDEYQEGEKLRVLPCNHAYHAKCIDPWLTKNRRTCPVCKRKVFATGEVPYSDSDSDSDHDDNHTENTPLLRSQSEGHVATSFSSYSSRLYSQANSAVTYDSDDDQSGPPPPVRRDSSISYGTLSDTRAATAHSENASLLMTTSAEYSCHSEPDPLVASMSNQLLECRFSINGEDGRSTSSSAVVEVEVRGPVEIARDALSQPAGQVSAGGESDGSRLSNVV